MDMEGERACPVEIANQPRKRRKRNIEDVPTTSCGQPIAEPATTTKQQGRKRNRTEKKVISNDESAICLSMLRLDPIIQFLTRATGKPLVALKTIKATLPSADETMLNHISELAEHGVLQIVGPVEPASLAWTSEHIFIGFPPPPSMDDIQNKLFNMNGTLHGSTKTAAKRRIAALKRSLKRTQPLVGQGNDGTMTKVLTSSNAVSPEALPGTEGRSTSQAVNDDDSDQEVEIMQQDEEEARAALCSMFQFISQNPNQPPDADRVAITGVLPKQVSYAGSSPGRMSSFLELHSNTRLPSALLDMFDLDRPGVSPVIATRRKLYSHQATAIESAMQGVHTLVCTGTGSGKSLCYLLPVIASALENNDTSLLMFPTKALAQDQIIKIITLLEKSPDIQNKVRPGIIDGDTSHAERRNVAKNCNIILTNPDTLHASILPSWKANYKSLLGRIKYVVIDEAHMYEGVFGSHVAMVLSRFVRLAALCSYEVGGEVRIPIFLACSATLLHPEHHFRFLCPIPKEANVTVLSPEDDGSPRAVKHFFVWNPPLMDVNGFSAGRVTFPKRRKVDEEQKQQKITLSNQVQTQCHTRTFEESDEVHLTDSSIERSVRQSSISKQQHIGLYRRHAADETALLLARAVSLGIRCIAFCKTRCLVEWVYERAISELKSKPSTKHLAEQVESYRGGYTMEARRLIEGRLFNNNLLGVVATNALELGVDVGGIDLTLHCGYPTSYASLLQQAGRAGRGSARLDVPSIAVMVCFDSPAEQQIWRRPRSLVGQGRTALVSMPINVGQIQGHLLCAGDEYPLAATGSIATLFSHERVNQDQCAVLSDCDLFGSKVIFRAAIDGLISSGMMNETALPSTGLQEKKMIVFKTHPFCQKPWSRVNLRSIEPINYLIVDLSHPMQGGKMDGVYNDRAVLDSIPYSRVFYHAFPGAIITHRGQRYKIQSMTRPPAFSDVSNGYKGRTFAAYAKPTSVRYTTRPLSTMKITVVKQITRIDDAERAGTRANNSESLDVYAEEGLLLQGSLAGNGVVTVCRSVHGYKKLSSITRVELSRTEFSLPSMQFDTFGFWLDTQASVLKSVIKDYDEGVHALSHAILAVAPLFVPSCSSDLNCDHQTHDCTRIVIFDMRAGGSGNSAQLFNYIFVPNGILESAIDLMETCSQCRIDHEYQGGCPACLHFGHCLKFNLHLNRKAAILIGKRLLERVQQTDEYKENSEKLRSQDQVQCEKKREHLSPRRNIRARALRNAQEVAPTKEIDVVMGRTCWAGSSHDRSNGSQVEAE